MIARWVTWAGQMLALLGIVTALPSAAAPDPQQCRMVRFSDVGWADVTATTALTTQLLERLGYGTRTTILSVPVTFNGLKRGDVDVFLGNWMPMQEADLAPFKADGSVETVRTNLADARYTLAVPEYVYAMGLTDFAAIQRFAGQLNNRIYGIEPGNDGNRLVMGMIRKNQFGLGGFTVVESSEQGMLAEVERAVRTKRPIVFLGWQPHPMNERFRMRYLSGGDQVFGPNFGGATVHTNVRQGYLSQCPNVGRLLRNLAFRVDDENALMTAVLASGDPAGAASKWLAAHPDRLAPWLAGVTTADGAAGLPAVQASLSRADTGAAITRYKIPVGVWMTQLMEAVKGQGRLFGAISFVLGTAVNALTGLLVAIPALLMVALVTALAYFLRRSIGLSVFVAL
ncbi:MAG: glycine/betaine transporter substrate-binding protein, partial [Marmoricola sp.]|nr:glycine/betaine transporter substrate-binding protein [Marmoricola sp.]